MSIGNFERVAFSAHNEIIAGVKTLETTTNTAILLQVPIGLSTEEVGKLSSAESGEPSHSVLGGGVCVSLELKTSKSRYAFIGIIHDVQPGAVSSDAIKNVVAALFGIKNLVSLIAGVLRRVHDRDAAGAGGKCCHAKGQDEHKAQQDTEYFL